MIYFRISLPNPYRNRPPGQPVALHIAYIVDIQDSRTETSYGHSRKQKYPGAYFVCSHEIRAQHRNDTEENKYVKYTEFINTPDRNEQKIAEAKYIAQEILKLKKLINSPEELSLQYFNLAADSKITIHFSQELYLQYRKHLLEIINCIENNKEFYCNKTPACKQCKYYRACPYI